MPEIAGQLFQGWVVVHLSEPRLVRALAFSSLSSLRDTIGRVAAVSQSGFVCFSLCFCRSARFSLSLSFSPVCFWRYARLSRSLSLSLFLSVCVSVGLFTSLSVSLSVSLSPLSLFLSVCTPASVCLFVCLSVCLSLSFSLSLCPPVSVAS